MKASFPSRLLGAIADDIEGQRTFLLERHLSPLKKPDS